MSRAAIALLSTEHIIHNVQVIKSYAPHAEIIAMIKANAYGHGLRSTALRLEPYVYSFGVASIDEALALRRVGIKIPITLMQGVFEPEELPIASKEGFQSIFHSATQVAWLKKISLTAPLTAWLKIDTGMGRLGFTPDEALHVYRDLSQNPCLTQPVGIMSHLACSEQPDHELNKHQIARFNKCIKNIAGKKSLFNSAAIFSFDTREYDVIRPGIALYGISPFKDRWACDLNLKPVMTLQTRLMEIKTIPKGSSIGYGARFISPECIPMGIIALGYGDGYPRSARDGTPVLINGIRCQIIGRVSMDMITVDLRPYPTAKIGDIVTLWGEGLPLEEVAPYTGLSVYDILTGVQSRVKFKWTVPL